LKYFCQEFQMNQQNIQHKGLIIFDGYCNLCSGLVQFLINRDKKDYFRFLSLQSDLTQKILASHKIPVNYNESIILIIENKLFFKSDAVLKITDKLGRFWVIFKVLRIIPKPMRDFLYDLVAKYRYKIFGKKQICMVSSENYRYKFID